MAETEKSLAYIRYAVDVMGVGGVGIGTHFSTTTMPWLTEVLLRDGFSDDDTARIVGGNLGAAAE